jgi:hypothetical protein
MYQIAWIQDLPRVVGIVYWMLALGALLLVLKVVKPWWAKVIGIAIVVGLFGYGPASVLRERHKATEIRKAAWAHYQARCRSAGVKIHRRVDNVDGVFLMKVRPDKRNFENQFELDDPYGSDLGGDGYIGSFLKESHINPDTGVPSTLAARGYQYVEARDPKDGKYYRYTGAIKEVYNPPRYNIYGPPVGFYRKKFVLEKAAIPYPTARYGVTYDDISTPDDRKFWIAGSSLRVIDLQTNEVIAERRGYMIDPGQGETSGGRSPWLIAANNACPAFVEPAQRHITRGSSAQIHQTIHFVAQILQLTR